MTEKNKLNEYETRVQKLHQLKAAGIIPYANKYEKKQSIKELQEISKTPSHLSDADILLKE